MTSLSLSMIVKNEEDILARCLSSVQNIADEIVIVDTGSTDNTKSVAKQFGAKIYEENWSEDFSKARNVSLGHCTSDWILVLDADEYLCPTDSYLIKELSKKSALQPTAVELKWLNYDDQNRPIQLMGINSCARLFSKHPETYWVKPYHEHLITPSNALWMCLNNVAIHHDGYSQMRIKKKKKHQREKKYLDILIKQEPDSMKWFQWCIYMGNFTFAAQDYTESAGYYERALSIFNNNSRSFYAMKPLAELCLHVLHCLKNCHSERCTNLNCPKKFRASYSGPQN